MSAEQDDQDIELIEHQQFNRGADKPSIKVPRHTWRIKLTVSTYFVQPV